MKKKNLLWFGLAVPAVVGGVAVYKKIRDDAANGSNVNARDSEFKQSNVSEVLHEQPDLDKKINRTENSSKEPPIRRRTGKTPESASKAARNENGKKILTGAKGGKYYLNEKGAKVYLKK